MAFSIVDFDDGTFRLRVAGEYYRWKFGSKGKPGLGILFKTDNTLPATEKEALDFEENHSEVEVNEMYEKLEKQAYKNILALNSLVKPLDEPPIPGLNQLEFFSLCLEDNDPAKVYAFFLIFSAGTTKLHEEIKRRIQQIIQKNPEMAEDLKEVEDQIPRPGD